MRDPLFFNGTTIPVFARPGATTQSLEQLEFYSFAIMILPYIEQASLYENIRSICNAATSAATYSVNNNPRVDDGSMIPYGGDAANLVNSPFSEGKIPALTCPSDRMGKVRADDVTTLGRLSYRYCHGDVWSHYYAPHQRGIGSSGSPNEAGTQRGRLANSSTVEDGLSNTLMFSESCICVSGTDAFIVSGVARAGASPSLEPKRCSDYRGSKGMLNLPTGITVWAPYKGRRWADGRNALFQAVLPPNSPTCFNSNENSEMMLTVSSYHTVGANAALCDGAVRFISNTIYTGDLTVVTPNNYAGASNYGIWGALGSVNGGESDAAP